MTTADVLAALPSRRVLVISDVHRISPEAPVPVVQATEERHVAGGAVNVAHNLAAAGVRASVFGTLGTDETGRLLAGILEKNGVAAGLCPRRAGTPTKLFGYHPQTAIREGVAKYVEWYIGRTLKLRDKTNFNPDVTSVHT